VARRHWGYVCDNSTPSEDAGGDVLESYVGVLNALAGAYQERDEELLARYGTAAACSVDVIQGDSRATELVALGSAKAVVTSPPYFGVTDYVKAQRLSMEWFGLPIEEFRQQEIGARSKRHRRTAVGEYQADLEKTFRNTFDWLVPGGYCAVIVGESASRARVIADLRDAIVHIGFQLVADINRRVSSQRRQAPSVVGEHIMVFRR
jgi:DNA modification methylase